MDGEYRKGGCVILVHTNGKGVAAWTNNGGNSFFIRPAEKDLFRFDPNRALSFMLHKERKGIVRCSRCGWEGKADEFIHGYMSEVLCVACNKDSTEECERDIATGNICRLCKKPRSSCVC
jgi:hypothetical protein